MLMLQPKFLGFSESTQYPALTIFLFLLSTCNRIYIFKQCVQVPENIQTPTTEGIGNSREVGGGVRSPGSSRGEGRGTIKSLSWGQYHFVCELSLNIASYRPGRSFLGHK